MTTSRITGRTSRSAREAFHLCYGRNASTNPITPDVLRYGWMGDLAYELSKGQGIIGGDVFGVTVVTDDGGRCTDLSTLFHSREAAEDYIRRRFGLGLVGRRYVYERDPAHGWVGVSIAELEALGIAEQVSAYSYWELRTRTVWLEEDRDVSLWLDRRREFSQPVPEFEEHYTDGDSRIRGLPAFVHPLSDMVAHGGP